MSRKSALAVLLVCCAALPATARAAAETDCAAQWKSADGNNDGVLIGPEADRYLAYFRVRAHVTPVDGRITQQEFMKSCQSDIFMAKAPEPGAPLKGANSFTEGRRPRSIACARRIGIERRLPPLRGVREGEVSAKRTEGS